MMKSLQHTFMALPTNSAKASRKIRRQPSCGLTVCTMSLRPHFSRAGDEDRAKKQGLSMHQIM